MSFGRQQARLPEAAFSGAGAPQACPHLHEGRGKTLSERGRCAYGERNAKRPQSGSGKEIERMHRLGRRREFSLKKRNPPSGLRMRMTGGALAEKFRAKTFLFVKRRS